ncbi:YeeE/YedE thiosulfate transporter family protein [Aeromicrobium sp.]|uniref:YeeE/YedE thiosulfate transporter family protein n=1 Tax=Aeromicrobium sp. TaxID=1871063 RepID=UPI0019C065FA|nr:YeeE/YedE thiosulfate transporter family protein [Aeromicrobium sp.]MBC7633808.1 YeeE/YedE family protein [Aeromicrobium sp.]
MILSILAGAVAGILLGYVLQRGQLCFNSAIGSSLDGRFLLARGWALGVALAAVGLALLFLLPGSGGLSRGLAFRPVANATGGLVIGIGMVVAKSCVSGLFYKLGSGMLGALVGLSGWAVGELLARQLALPGPTLLPGGEGATIPGLLDVPRLVVAVLLLVAVAVALWLRPGSESPVHVWQWGWQRTGVGLGVAITAGWALAALGDSSFGPSSVGAVASIAGGSPNYWLITFLLGIVAGGALSARTAGGFWLRGEKEPVRYLQLAVGGLLLGAGGWIAGGCNVGHGLSGVAQLNVSSFVVVVAMVAGVWGARRAAGRAAQASVTRT